MLTDSLVTMFVRGCFRIVLFIFFMCAMFVCVLILL